MTVTYTPAELRKMVADATPVPWKVDGFFAADDSWHVHGPKGQWLASVNYDNDPKSEKDARLMAQSPTIALALADALEEVARLRGLVRRVVEDPHWRTCDNTLWPDLCAALARKGDAE